MYQTLEFQISNCVCARTCVRACMRACSVVCVYTCMQACLHIKTYIISNYLKLILLTSEVLERDDVAECAKVDMDDDVIARC